MAEGRTMPRGRRRARALSIALAAITVALTVALTGAVTGSALLGTWAEAAADDGGNPAPGETGLIPVTDFFKGKVTRLTKKGEISILYDFEDPVQLTDFELALPFRAIRTVEAAIDRGQLRVKGTGSYRHRAVFDGLVGGDGTFTPKQPRDFGYAVTEERESEVFTLYCVQDRYFGLGDNVDHAQNMIIKFIPRDPKVNRDGYQDWRYCGSRGENPPVSRNQPVIVKIEREGNESRMWLLDWKSKGKEAGRDLSSQMIALYTYDSDIVVDDLTISGRLSPAFVQRNRIDLSVEIGDPEAEEPEEPEIAIDPAEAERVRALLADYPLRTSAPDLAKLIRDTTVPLPLRNDAVERAVAVGAKKVVPFVVQGLYAEDEDTRRLSIELVNGLVGKTFGYSATAPEAKRSKAIATLNSYLQKHVGEFQ